MNCDQLNEYLTKRGGRSKFLVVPFIYGYNEDGQSVFTINDTKIKGFSCAKGTKKSPGFQDYMTNLKYEMLFLYPSFSVVAFAKFGPDDFIPCCEMAVNTVKNNSK